MKGHLRPSYEAPNATVRKRLLNYVCPATDGDADERTSGFYIVPISPDLKPLRLLFFSFFSSFSSSFSFLASSSSSSSRPTGRCASLYRDCISIAMLPTRRCIHSSVYSFLLAYRFQRRGYHNIRKINNNGRYCICRSKISRHWII